MPGGYTISFRCSRPIQIVHQQRHSVHMRAAGGEPADKLLLYPDRVAFGLFADSVAGSADIQTGIALYGHALDMGIGMHCAEILLGDSKTLLYTDPKTLRDLDRMTLDGVPFE